MDNLNIRKRRQERKESSRVRSQAERRESRHQRKFHLFCNFPQSHARARISSASKQENGGRKSLFMIFAHLGTTSCIGPYCVPWS